MAEFGCPAPASKIWKVSQLGVAAPAFSLRKKTDHGSPFSKEKAKTPAPNHYKLPEADRDPRSSRKKSAAYSMSGRYKESKRPQTPGAGAYNPQNSVGCSSLKKKAPSYSLSSRPKTADAATRSPGPTKYNPNYLPTRQSGQKWSMVGKPKKAKNDTVAKEPGPGHYAGLENFQGKGRKAPSYSMKGRHKGADANSRSPGPTQYAIEKTSLSLQSGRRKSPSFSMTGRWKKKETTSSTPGPGSYSTIGGFGRTCPPARVWGKTR